MIVYVYLHRTSGFLPKCEQNGASIGYIEMTIHYSNKQGRSLLWNGNIDQ